VIFLLIGVELQSRVVLDVLAEADRAAPFGGPPMVVLTPAQPQSIAATIADNDSIFVDGETFKLTPGTAKAGTAAQINALAARELGPAPSSTAPAANSTSWMRRGRPRTNLLITRTFEVLVWSLAYSIVNVASAGVDLVYFAFVNYTTLGYGDVLPVESWRLLGPITAMNGVLLFGGRPRSFLKCCAEHWLAASTFRSDQSSDEPKPPGVCLGSRYFFLRSLLTIQRGQSVLSAFGLLGHGEPAFGAMAELKCSPLSFPLKGPNLLRDVGQRVSAPPRYFRSTFHCRKDGAGDDTTISLPHRTPRALVPTTSQARSWWMMLRRHFGHVVQQRQSPPFDLFIHHRNPASSRKSDCRFRRYSDEP
jgi:hypothetical protein